MIYLRERLSRLQTGFFIEIGPGSGEITDLLLESGWNGITMDLNETTIESLRTRFGVQIESGRLVISNQDFNSCDASGLKANLVISCMVMEHMEDQQESDFVQQAGRCLAPGGMMIGLVPGSPAHWGIEDEIAGHIRRYTRESLEKLMEINHWQIRHCAGLTFPLSNLLLPLSNFLVERAEKNKLDLSKFDRTKLSGIRNVSFKTHFPSIAGILLNRVTLLPFHFLQKFFANSSRALVLYFEAEPDTGANEN
ncbi:MAG: class I SAM-dependent methyltransferase [Gammaproteobacteria bacterium]|nr:class I SAM-dependent methyltransferase [Gammaproteobacteria bacterium]